MYPFFYKKRILFLALFSFILALFLKLSLWNGEKNNQNIQSFSYQKQKISTSCREIFIDNAKKVIESTPQRFEQVNKLMTTPIDWVFKDIHGQVLDLYCLREKKNIIIHFWATWCSPCIKELPALARFADTNKNQVFVVAISTESLKVIRNFLNQAFSDLNPQLKIAQVSQAKKSEYFPEDSLPVTYIFDKKGLLMAKELGPRNWSDKHVMKQITNK